MLSQGDHEALRVALDEDITPTPALQEAWQLHHDQVVRAPEPERLYLSLRVLSPLQS